MNTPKEKAEDLVLKYSILEDGHNDLVKQCALIAVDEIIKAGKDVDEFCDSYWQEVKNEIKLL